MPRRPAEMPSGDSKRGGPRPGAGRPREEHGERAVNGTLRLYPSTWALLDQLADELGLTRREVIAEALDALAAASSEAEKGEPIGT